MNDKIEIVEQTANELDGESIADYSGRGMYGKKSAAISIGSRDLHETIQLATLLGLEDIGLIDSMGLGVVVYWPDIETEEIEEGL